MFRRSDLDIFMETYIGKPLLMHLTLSVVFSFRSSTKHENGTHFGVMDENGLTSIEKEKFHIASPLKISKKMMPNSFITPGIVLHLDKQTSVKHLTALKRLCFVMDSFVCVHI